MNSQRPSVPYYQKPLSTISQLQTSSLSIKPLVYPCRYHPDQACQNYCIQPKCFQVLCSECIQQHLLHHKKQNLNDLYVKSYKSVRTQCSNKLMKIIDKLYSKLGVLKQPKNPQQLIQDTDRTLQQIRGLMHQIIDQQFLKIRESIKTKISQTFISIKQLTQIHQNLIKIINQLKQHNSIISQGIVDHQINVNDSIQKTLQLNQNALLQMFQRQSVKYEQKYKGLNLDISFNQNQFRQSAIGSLKFGVNNQNQGSINSNMFTSNISARKQTPKVNTISIPSYDQSNSRLRSRSKSPLNNRQQNSFSNRNDQNSPYPILHYFETGSNILHLIDMKSSQPTKFVYNLPKYLVPSFHASILSQKTGAILISGGNIQHQNLSTKSTTVSKYSLVVNEFKKDFATVKPRSSHTLCQDPYNQFVYIIGGYGQVPSDSSQQDQSLTTFQTTLERINLKNGQVQQLHPSNWGGANLSFYFNNYIVKGCMQGIQIYDIQNDRWVKINNIKTLNLQKVFCRGAGYTIIKPNIILIYGGYDQSQQGSKDCYLMSINLSSSLENTNIDIHKIDSLLPVPEGFWNNPGILYQGNLYVIQNLQDQEGQTIQSERTLLKFNIQSRKWNIIRISQVFKKN